MICRRSITYAATGAAVAIGAPVGWFTLRLVGGMNPLQELSRNTGLYAYLLGSSAVAFMCFGAALGFLADRLARANAQLAESAITDPLTTLKNVRYFQERLRSECARADRERSSLSLIVLDVDHFKDVNDSLGHAVGDRVLAQIGCQIAASIRSVDVACRIGGEEFAVICPGAPLREAATVAERIRTRIEANPDQALGGFRRMTVSLGVGGHVLGESEGKLFRNADAAMYEAKRLGRNQVAVAKNPDVADSTQERAPMDESQMELGLERSRSPKGSGHQKHHRVFVIAPSGDDQQAAGEDSSGADS